MKIKYKLIIGLFASVVLVLPLLAFADSLPKEGLVTKVFDGDTIELDGKYVVRYIGIDAPEYMKKDKGEWIIDPQPLGEEAKRFNESLIQGKRVRLEYDSEKIDIYKRLLSYVFVRNELINARLIKEGLALAYIYPDNVRYKKRFLKFQEEAKKKKKGLWEYIERNTILPHQAEKFVGKMKAVEGVVLTTARVKKCIFLNFGKDYKKDFTIVIFKSVWKLFDVAGIEKPEVFYRGKKVRVYGLISEYNGPEIKVKTPYQIQLIQN